MKHLESGPCEELNQVVISVDMDNINSTHQYAYEYHYHKTVVDLRERLYLGVKVSYSIFEDPQNMITICDETLSYAP